MLKRMREIQARLTHAKALRAGQTDAELKLWYHLRAGRLGGYKFKRQVRLGPYIVDFACLETKLIVELDGSQHLESVHDLKRDAAFHEQGFQVLRFWNDAALRETAAVLEVILSTLKASPLPSPLPQAGEGVQSQST